METRKNGLGEKMAFKPINCPHCNEELQIPDNKEMVNCMFCQKEIIVKEVLKEDAGNKLEHLFVLANSALDGNNFPEAYKYYSQILELDSTNPRAWFGKASAAGLNSFEQLREMMVGFANTIKYAADNEKNDYEQKAGAIILTACIFHLKTADNCVVSAGKAFNLNKNRGSFLEGIVTRPYVESNAGQRFNDIVQAVDFFVARSSESITLLEKAYESSSSNEMKEMTAVGIIQLCDKNFLYMGIVAHKMTFPSEIGQFYVDIRNKYVYELKQINPKSLEEVNKQFLLKPSQSPCFVVTATMGSDQHPRVKILREFRNTFLANTTIGQSFIEWYELYGPKVASFIRKSVLLRTLSYVLIVYPISEIAKYFIKKQACKLD